MAPKTRILSRFLYSFEAGANKDKYSIFNPEKTTINPRTLNKLTFSIMRVSSYSREMI